MIKSDLIKLLAEKKTDLSIKEVQDAVNEIFDSMINAILREERIEIRDFGNFSLRHRAARMARNPKTGEIVNISDKYHVHFKPGKGLKETVDHKRS